ncbi:hypothetical protein GCM10010515_67630 [Streptomyces fructofermentans]|uniref:Lipoprotein n=2 Tax=Streptomyces fructofermentans TaxID=152141 RepID=A0A918NS16_9ACTN|nr:hypothetical protein GCM10010515_67630 [Streptomyces fructofermentans]
MKRLPACLLAATLLVSVASCSEATERRQPAPASSSPRAPSPAPATDTGKNVDAVRKVLLSQPGAKGRDAPDAQGALVAADGPGAALFVWETRDGRFCHGTANGTGSSSVGCETNPRKVGRAPRLVPLLSTAAVEWNVVFGAEGEVAESAACNGAAVDLREVGVMADGRRTIYAVEFSDLRSGSLDVEVTRGKRTAEERLELLPGADADSDTRRCG